MRSRTILLMIIALGHGCVEQDVDQAVDQAESALVGGAATNARPEIGQFLDGATGSCTATLITPSVVLTAGHCLVPEYTARTPLPGAQFSFTDAGGQPRTVAVDRVHSFATKRYERTFPGSPMTTDVAIVHLATPVPASQATPAVIAPTEPSWGSTSTIWGFGCTSRDPRTGGGFKQAFPLSWGTWTRALCWGDSGGPVVFNTPFANGPIWGVNSDFEPVFPFLPNDWLDVFASVPWFRRQIDAVIREWEGPDELDRNRDGLDYAWAPVGSTAGCRARCEADDACRAFTWNSSTGYCFLKAGAADPTPFAGAFSGLPSRYEFGVNRDGSDFAWPAIATYEGCEAECARTSGCRAWTHLNGTCWMKNAVPPKTTGTCPFCVSGVAGRNLERWVDRPGADYTNLPVSSTFECANACASDVSCQVFTHDGARCWLKSSVPTAQQIPPRKGSVVVSGVRRGLEINSDRIGLDYQVFTTTSLSPTVCQAACAQQAQCRAWSYHPPAPWPASTATCALKSGIPQRVSSTGSVSGVKGLEWTP